MSKGLSPPRLPRESSEALTARSRARISIVDRTQITDDSASSRPQTPANDEASSASDFRIKASRTRSSTIRDQKAKWKYGKYSEERALDRPLSRKQTEIGAEATASQDLTQTDSRWGQSALQRGRKKVQDKVLGRKRTSTLADRDTEVDVLYENQRGAFFCGIPFFSPKALNPLDPAPWTDGSFQRSRENITNAQVPDPSWEWVWRTWYVDMSRDVDEEGWEYSFFAKGFSWHGTHPWFHSFVRRRRWIRKRIRRRHERDMTDPHGLTKDYFTIHTGRVRSITSRPDSPTSQRRTSKKFGIDEKATWEEDDIFDIGTLTQGLKVAPVDSERIALIKKFIDHGGQDLYYLADEMPSIMSYFFHEHSCRRLLTILTEKIQAADSHLLEHQKSGQTQDADEKRYTEALMKAAEAVDEQCKRLQFWSDAQRLPKVNKVSFDLDDKDVEEHSSGTAKAGQDADRASSKQEGLVESIPSKAEKGKNVIAQDAVDIGGFDGTWDAASPVQESSSQPATTNGSTKHQSEPRALDVDRAHSKSSHSSLRRKSSPASSLKLAELMPEPVVDLPDDTVLSTPKSKASRR